MSSADPELRERLIGHPVFAGVDREALRRILARVRPRHVQGGALITTPDRAQCNLVLCGLVHSYALTADGRRLVFDIVRPGGLDGLLNAVGLDGHFAEAAEPSVVAPLSAEIVDELIEADPRVAVNLLRMTLTRLERREAQLESATGHEATRRLARLLLALSKYLGATRSDGIVELRPKPAHQLLADMLGLRRETVTLQMSLLRSVAAVQTERDHFLIDRVALQALVDGASPQQVRPGRLVARSRHPAAT